MATPTEPRKKKAKVSPDDTASSREERKKKKHLSDLTNDTELINRIMKLASTEEDPPVVFDWNTQSLEEFWNKAVAYQATVVAIAIPINGGVNLPAAVDVDFLKGEILEYLRGLQPGPPAARPTRLGNTVGLGCSQVQSMNLINFLSRLEIDNAWFQAVTGHLAPLTASLATVHTPRPRNAKGLLDEIIIGGQLWG